MGSIEGSTALVLDRDRSRSVGLAFLVTNRALLTCAHVVNTSLGRPLRETAPVPGGLRVPVEFALPGSSDDRFGLDATVVEWLPTGYPLDLDEDVAVLWLSEDPSRFGAEPLTIGAEAGEHRPAAVAVWEAPARDRHVRGRLVGPVGRHRRRVSDELQGSIGSGRGLSGGPAWDPRSGEVVGMLQAIDTDDGSADVSILSAAVLRQALTTARSPGNPPALIDDSSEVHYDGATYSVRHSLWVKESPVAPARYEVAVSAARPPDEETEPTAEPDRRPMDADRLGLRAWHVRDTRRVEMRCVPVGYRDEQIGFLLYLPEGDEPRPGQSARIEYTYAVSNRRSGYRYERQIRDATDRLSIAARLPTALEPECWGTTSSPTRPGLEPLHRIAAHVAGDSTVYSWERMGEAGIERGSRVQLRWFFWRRILDSHGVSHPSQVMAQFGILQVRDPSRGRRLPRHIPDAARIRSINLASPDERRLAGGVLDHLRRAAGWVTRYHTFRPAVGMGIAAPQLGMDYRIAIIRKPHSQQFVELINPRILATSPELADDYERCFSFFSFRGLVRRPVSVTVAYDRLNGERVTGAFTGAMARNVQHEIDHLDSKLYTDDDRMPQGIELMPVERTIGRS